MANERKNVLENKKTDGQSNSAKIKCWLEITEKYNSITKSSFRDVKNIRNKYEAIKRDLRKADNGGREWKKTGGGPSKPPLPPLTEEEKELRNTIILSCDGMVPLEGCDGDDGYAQGTVPSDIYNTEDRIVIEELEVDWGDASAGMLQTPVHHLLQSSNSQQIVNITQPVAITPTVTRPYTSSIESNIENDLPLTNSLTEIPQSNPRGFNRQRPKLQKKSSNASASSKFERLAMEKIRLLAEKEEILKIERKIADADLVTAEKNAIAADKNIEVAKVNLDIAQCELRIKLLKEKKMHQELSFTE